MEITPYYSGREAYNVKANDGTEYVFVPQEFLNKGFVLNGEQWYDPDFLRPDLLDKAKLVELPANAAYTDQAKSLYEKPNLGYVWAKDDFADINKDDFTFHNYKITEKSPAIQGLVNAEGTLAYKTSALPGWQTSYITGMNPDGQTNFRSWKTEGGGSFLGGLVGNWFDDLTSATGIQDIAGDVNDFFQTDLGKAIKWASLASSLSNLATEGAGTEVGSATGPDNIDVGGGWSPAAGATEAELASARLALEQPAELTDVDAALADLANSAPPEFSAPAETVTTAPPVETPPPTSEQITSNIAGDNIDAGGGWSPATGATEAELAAARAAMASTGWTFSQALNAVRAGLLVNAITGDPLNLSGTGGTQSATPTGFAQVEVPSEWKSPEYSYTPVQNVSFEDLFPGVSLQGTQWQGLQGAQPNMTFNDIFAAGMQNTPMGSPVDINQIVSSIVGQNAKS